jgi:succinate dehydrogenase/fumarate reductase flavoprotein subunit
MSDPLRPLTPRIPTDLSQLNDHDTVDVVVIGSGGAGFSAALNAAIDGARVLLVERMAHVGGTTAWSAATTWIPGTKRGL